MITNTKLIIVIRAAYRFYEDGFIQTDLFDREWLDEIIEKTYG